MFQVKWRLWKLCLFTLAFLTIYNIFLTIKLMYSTSCSHNPTGHASSRESKKDCQKENAKKQTSSETDRDRNLDKELKFAQKIYQSIESSKKYSMNLNLGLGRHDNRLMYKLFDNVIVGDRYVELSEEYLTCLATQSSLDKLASVVESSLYWGGPISLAAFATNERELNRLLLYILYLRKCNSRIKEKVTFHIAMVKEKGPKTFIIDEDRLDKMECDNPMGVLKALLKELNKPSEIIDVFGNFPPMINSWRYKVAYPQNHLRNLARKNCHTKYVFLTDVDIIPSKGMAESLNDFLKAHVCVGKCAYVVPTYELDERVLFPPNKTDLIRMANKGLARPFHHKVFIYNQYATNFTRWQSYKDSSAKVRISHPVTNFEFLYEPFYIASDDVPPHDERFVGYGYTRNSQVYEMFVAGYEFYVLSPIFTCHWGLQIKRTRPPWREHQNNQNRKNFDRFKKEIYAKYDKDPLNMIASKPKTT